MWREWKNCYRDRLESQIGTGWYLDPSPRFFVSVDSKGVRNYVSLLESTLRGYLTSVASKGFKFTVGGGNFFGARAAVFSPRISEPKFPCERKTARRGLPRLCQFCYSRPLRLSRNHS